MTETANPNLSHAEKVFKDLVWDALVKAALARLFIAVPWLAWGPLGAVVGFIVNIYADKLFKELELGLDLTYIKFHNKEGEKEFRLASVKLSIEAIAHGVDSPEYKEANEKAKAAFAQYVAFTSK